MELKKGDVYKEAKGSGWFRIINPNYSRFCAYEMEFLVEYSNGALRPISYHWLENRIQQGKLIKIPQLYK